MKKNQEFTVLIEDIGVNGEGIGRVDGYPLFMFARHGRALTGVSPEHAQIVGSV